MTMHSNLISRAIALTLATAALAACGGDGGSQEKTGFLTLGVTDAPVDHAEDVVVEFSGVELKPRGGPAFSIDFVDPANPTQPLVKEIHLLDYQGEDRAVLLDGEEIPAGEYEWMRLKVNAEPNVVDSYIVLETDGGQCELEIPSGAQTGLKMIRGFTVASGALTDFTIDFDLRKSVVAPPGQQTGEPLTCDGQAYFLKPVLRVVDNLQVGSITGVVDPALVAAACEADPADPNKAGNVYLFGPYEAAEQVPANVPDDVDGAEADGADPIDTAIVDPATGAYTFGFVEADKKYALAYTCDEDASDVDADLANTPSAEADEVVTFTPPTPDEPALVTTNQTTQVNFSPLLP